MSRLQLVHPSKRSRQNTFSTAFKRLGRLFFRGLWSVLSGLIALLLIVAWSLQKVPLEPFEHRVETILARSFGANVEIMGASSIQFGRQVIAEADSIAIWRDEPAQSFLGGPVRLTLDLASLVAGRVLINDLDIEALEIDTILEDSKRRANSSGSEIGASKIKIAHARLAIASAFIKDPAKKRRYILEDAEVKLASFDLAGDASFTGQLKLKGRHFRREGRTQETIKGFEASLESSGTGQLRADISGELAREGIFPLIASRFDGMVGPFNETGSVPINGQLVIGDITSHLDGSVAAGRSEDQDKFTIQVTASGGETLEQVTGYYVDLPKAQLRGELALKPGETILTNLRFTNGDLSAWGDLKLSDRKTRPALSGNLSINQVSLPTPKPVAPAAGLIPEPVVPTEWMDKVDVELALNIGKLPLWQRSVLTNASAQISLEDRNMRLTDFEADLPEGTLKGDFQLDGRGDEAQSKVVLQVSGLPSENLVNADTRLDLGDSTSALNLNLSMIGDELPAMANSATGHMNVSAVGGKLSIGAAERLVIGLGGLIDPLVAENKEVKIHCTLLNFNLVNGLATSNGILIDTEEFAIAGAGEIDLKGGSVDLALALHPANKQLLRLSTAFKLQGTITEPRIEPGSDAIVKGLANVAGATIRPLGAIALVQGAQDGQARSCEEAVSQSTDVDLLPIGLSGVLSLGENVVETTIGTFFSGAGADEDQSQNRPPPARKPGSIRDRIRGVFQRD